MNNMTLNPPCGLDVWSETWVSVLINAWLCLLISLTMCVFDSCWPLFISLPWRRLRNTASRSWSLSSLLTSNNKKFCGLEGRLLNQRWHHQISYAFDHGIDWLRKNCSHMSHNVPPHWSIVPNIFWVINQVIQLHLTYSHKYLQDATIASSSPCTRIL